MRIGIIGAGNLGCSLALGLLHKGYSISGVYSKSEKSSAFLGSLLDTHYENCIVSAISNSELVFITVPDDTINNVAENIAKDIDAADICGKIFFHCSGSKTSDMLIPIKLKGGYIGSLHPIQTFADRTHGWKGLECIYYGFEGSSEAWGAADRIVKALNGNIITIQKENKSLYHAAACILSNYFVTLSFIAGSMFERIGINHDTGIKAFLPLVEKTVKNVGELGSLKALTGPISRGDCKVVEDHINSIMDKSPTIIDIYKLLGMATTDIALKKGSIDEHTADALIKVLKG